MLLESETRIDPCLVDRSFSESAWISSRKYKTPLTAEMLINVMRPTGHGPPCRRGDAGRHQFSRGDGMQ